MNPYASTKASGTDLPLEDPTEHPSYQSILKMVLWGEPKEKIDQKIRVNNIPPSIAEQIYHHARADRINTIRSESLKELVKGLSLIVVGLLTFTAFWFGLNFIPRVLLYSCFAAIAYGIWKFADGTLRYLMADRKTGSIAVDS